MGASRAEWEIVIFKLSEAIALRAQKYTIVIVTVKTIHNVSVPTEDGLKPNNVNTSYLLLCHIYCTNKPRRVAIQGFDGRCTPFIRFR